MPFTVQVVFMTRAILLRDGPKPCPTRPVVCDGCDIIFFVVCGHRIDELHLAVRRRTLQYCRAGYSDSNGRDSRRRKMKSFGVKSTSPGGLCQFFPAVHATNQ